MKQALDRSQAAYRSGATQPSVRDSRQQLEERISEFETAGGYIEVLDWRDLMRDQWSKKLVWRHPKEHPAGQRVRDRSRLKVAIYQASLFPQWRDEGGEGPRSLAVRACRAFLGGPGDSWLPVLLLAWDQDDHLQGVALTERDNKYVNNLEILASNGKMRGVGSALLRKAAQMTLTEVEGYGVEKKRIEERMRERGWLGGCLEVESNKNGESLYLQYGGKMKAKLEMRAGNVAIYGKALRDLAGPATILAKNRLAGRESMDIILADGDRESPGK